MSASPSRPEDKHVDGAKRRLSHLAGLSQKTEEAERKILAAAEDRLAVVDADLDKLRPRVELNPVAAGRYQDRMIERGHLVLVIARARKVIGL